MSFLVRPAIECDKKYLEPQSLRAGTTLSIPVKVTGKPQPTVTWSLNDKSLAPGGNVTIVTEGESSMITVKPCNRTESGIYLVSAQNIVGTANKEFEVIVKDVPSVPRELKVTDIQKESIAITWQVPEDDGGSPITGYVIEKRDAKKNTWASAGKVKPAELAFTLMKLIEGNEYYIRVIAENEIGQSQPAELPEPVKAKSPFGK